MERKLKPIDVQRILKEKGIRLFSPVEFQRSFSVTLRAAQEFIKDHSHDIFLKVRNGLYALRIELPPDEAIANRLCAPSYISRESALSFYGILSQIPQMTTCVTLNLPRIFKTNFGVVEYRQIKKDFFCNFVKREGYLIAEPEKALLDYLYFSRPETRAEKLSGLNLQGFKKKKLADYAEKIGMPWKKIGKRA